MKKKNSKQIDLVIPRGTFINVDFAVVTGKVWWATASVCVYAVQACSAVLAQMTGTVVYIVFAVLALET